MNEEFFSSEAEARQRVKYFEANDAWASLSFLPTADERGAWLVRWGYKPVYLNNKQENLNGRLYIFGTFDLSKPEKTEKGTERE